MLSDVVITGKVGERKGTLRYLMTSHEKNCYSDDEIVSKVPLLYWTRNTSNVLNNLKVGVFVMCRGRIEYDKALGGLYILVETLIVPK